MILASAAAFVGTIWWTLLVAGVAFVAGGILIPTLLKKFKLFNN